MNKHRVRGHLRKAPIRAKAYSRRQVRVRGHLSR
jgi:hypothetical protein